LADGLLPGSISIKLSTNLLNSLCSGMMISCNFLNPWSSYFLARSFPSLEYIDGVFSKNNC
jgi:hypothetical protein